MIKLRWTSALEVPIAKWWLQHSVPLKCQQVLNTKWFEKNFFLQGTINGWTQVLNHCCHFCIPKISLWIFTFPCHHIKSCFTLCAQSLWRTLDEEVRTVDFLNQKVVLFSLYPDDVPSSQAQPMKRCITEQLAASFLGITD